VLVSGWGAKYRSSLLGAAKNTTAQFDSDPHKYVGDPQQPAMLVRDTMINHVFKDDFHKGFILANGSVDTAKLQGYLNKTFQNKWAAAQAKLEVKSRMKQLNPDGPEKHSKPSPQMYDKQVNLGELSKQIEVTYDLQGGKDMDVKWKEFVPKDFDVITASTKYGNKEGTVKYLMENKDALIKQIGKEKYQQRLKKAMPFDYGPIKDKAFNKLEDKIDDRIDSMTDLKQNQIDLEHGKIKKADYREKSLELLKHGNLSLQKHNDEIVKLIKGGMTPKQLKSQGIELPFHLDPVVQ